MTQASFPDDQAKKKKNRIISIWDGVFASFNIGCGETHVSAFIILFQATNLQVGLLASLPNLIASLFQLKTPACVEKVGSRKKIIVLSVMLQLMMWFPIIAIAFTGWERHSVPFLILFYSLYSTFGSFLAPAWGSLMSESVAEKERGRYFGLRGKIGGMVTVLSGFGAGYLLYTLQCPVYQRFALVFLMMGQGIGARVDKQ